MFSTAPRVSQRSLIPLLAVWLAGVATLSGCGDSPTAQQAFDLHARENPNFKKQAVAKFAGRVTVDGQPPAAAKDRSLFIILNDPAHLDAAAHSGPTIYTTCKPDGSFSFTTYVDGDGVPLGKYVVTFVDLKRMPHLGFGSHARERYGGGDRLKNLYSDPDKNSKSEQFVIEVAASGKEDYEFILAVAGKDATQPSPNAIKTLAMP